MKKSLLLSFAATLPAAGSIVPVIAQDKPNILWLTIEDTSWYEFGTYGNEHAKTPNLDYLAANGVRFTHAWSCGPQSSPARSTIITGCYSSTYGMEWHRDRVLTPKNIFFPQLLRDAGYYCTNNAKTDYNTTNNNNACWDECKNTASYNNSKRKDDQPFFAVYNTGMTHMGRIRTFHTDGRRDFSKEGIDPARLNLPPHLPDLPEVRSDHAFHLEGVTDVDKWVGIFISDLKQQGLWDNTIIFFYSDHGGCSPRGKGYLYESGLRVPMIVYIPPKYRDQFNIIPGTVSDRLVSFVDLAPTVLSLTGVSIPAHYQGHAFLGPKKTPDNPMQYGISCNQATHYQPLRAANNGRYKYIRRYIPYKQHSLRNYYQWGMPANMAWDKTFLTKQCTTDSCNLPFTCEFTEELFDQSVDSFDVNNLADHPDYREILSAMRDSIKNFNRNTRDLGFFLSKTRMSKDVYTYVRTSSFPLNDLYDLIDMTLEKGNVDTNKIIAYLDNEYPEFRFWAIVNLAHLGNTGRLSVCPPKLKELINDSDPQIATEAACALCFLGEGERGITYLLNDMPTYKEEKTAILECLALNPQTQALFTPGRINFLKTKTAINNYNNQKDMGLLVRGILANLGEWDADRIFPPESYAEGVSLNQTRRAIKPMPGGDKTAKVILSENFEKIGSGIKNTPVTNLDKYTNIPGWTYSSGVFYDQSGSYGGGLKLVSNESFSAWVDTPPLDLQTSFTLSFYSKKNGAINEGTIYALLDNDTIFQFENPNNTYNQRRVGASFIATPQSKIRFLGNMAANNIVHLDSVVITESIEPAINLPQRKILDLGTHPIGKDTTAMLMLEGANLEDSPIVFRLAPNPFFEITGTNEIILSEDQESDNTVHFRFLSPETAGIYTARVDIDGGGLTPRILWLKGTSTGLYSSMGAIPASKVLITVSSGKVLIESDAPGEVQIFGISGQVIRKQPIGHTAEVALHSGFYIFRVITSSGITVKKIIL